MSEGPTYRGKPLPENLEKLMSERDKKALGLFTLPPAEVVVARVQKLQDKSEKVLQQDIAQYLSMRGIEFNVSRMDRAKTDKVGWPDFTLGIRPVQFPYAMAVGFEVKLPGREPTPEQYQQMANMIRSGWFVRVVHSVAETKTFLDRLAEWNPHNKNQKVP